MKRKFILDNDCIYYAEKLSGQVFMSEEGNQTYECHCKLVPSINPNKEDKKDTINLKIDENSFELSLRILSNEFVAIKIGSTNFSGKLIAGGILLLFFTLILLEGFGLNELLMK